MSESLKYNKISLTISVISLIAIVVFVMLKLCGIDSELISNMPILILILNLGLTKIIDGRGAYAEKTELKKELKEAREEIEKLTEQLKAEKEAKA